LRFSFSEATATKQPFDRRWTLFFTPHSAAIEPDLIARAKGSWWWNEAPCRFDIPGIRAGARRAREAHCTAYMPSLECYTYTQIHEEFGEPWLKGRRQVPFGFGWLAEGASPYRELPVRAARLAYREYTADPDLTEQALRAALGRGLFGRHWNPAQVEDTLELSLDDARTGGSPAQNGATQSQQARLVAGAIGSGARDRGPKRWLPQPRSAATCPYRAMAQRPMARCKRSPIGGTSVLVTQRWIRHRLAFGVHLLCPAQP
jgi:hypothetical protein